MVWLTAAPLSWRLSGQGGACYRNLFSRCMWKRVTNPFLFGHRLVQRTRVSFLPLFLSSSVVEWSAVNWLVVGSNPTWGENQKDFWNKTQTGRCKKRRISRRVNFFHTHGLILHVKMFYSVVDITLYLYIRREWYAKRLNEDFLPALKFNTFDSRNGYPFRVLNRLGSCLLSFYQQIARWDSYLYHSVLLSFY